MRFLTVPELLPRRQVSGWVADWCNRADQHLNAKLSRDLIFSLFNEGTLLLFRTGAASTAANFCEAAATVAASRVDPSRLAFQFQQVINLTRLAVSKKDWRSTEDLFLDAEYRMLQAPDYSRPKMLVVLLVERCAAYLAGARFDRLADLEACADGAARSCVLETMFRAREQQAPLADEAIRSAEISALLSGSDLDRLAGLCLEATTMPTDRHRSAAIVEMISNGVTQRPVHFVQVGEFVLRSRFDETRAQLSPVVRPLLQVSIALKDAPGLEFFSRCLGTPIANDEVLEPSAVLQRMVSARLEELLNQVAA